MLACWNIHVYWSPLPAQIDAADRFRAVQDLSSGGNPIWLILIVVGISVVGVLAVVYYTGRQMAGRNERALFDTHAAHRGLSDAEKQCLLKVSEAAGINAPSSIFTLPTVFARGEEQLIRRIGHANVSEAEHSRIRVQLASLREKLGFTGRTGQKSGRLSLVDTIETGSHLTAVHPDTGEVMDVSVADMASTELTIHVAGGVNIQPGQQWILRYSHGQTIWEFDATVVAHADGKAVLHYCGEVRFVNRRRYRRTETALPAQICDYGFTSGNDNSQPQFTPATVVEIGGPGLMMVETTHSAAVNDKVLIIVKFRSQSVIQSLANVRWTSRSPSGLATLGLEMIGLSDRDLNMLIHESTLAQRALGAEPSSSRFRANDEAASANREHEHDRAM